MAQIPIVDISTSRPRSDVAIDLVDAAITHGFVFVKNRGHNVSTEKIDGMFDLASRFFDTSVDEKSEYKINQSNHGWSGMHVEKLGGAENKHGDFKEAFNVGEFIDNQPQQALPPCLKDQERDLRDFHGLCHELCMKILDLFASGLEIRDKTWFSTRHRGGPSGTVLRLLYYPLIPPSASPPSSTSSTSTSKHRAGAHSDYGTITLLFQRATQPGLEVLSPITSTFEPVPVYPPGTENDPSPPILVNIGDLLSYWTRGLFRSTVHRVVFPEGGAERRYSMAYFCHPVDTTVLEAVPSERLRAYEGGKHMLSEKPLTAHEHLMERLRATYSGVWDSD